MYEKYAVVTNCGSCNMQIIREIKGGNPEALKKFAENHALIWDPEGGLWKSGHPRFGNAFPGSSKHSTYDQRDKRRQTGQAELKHLSLRQQFIYVNANETTTGCCNNVDHDNISLQTSFLANCGKCLVVCDECDGGRVQGRVAISSLCKKCPIACPIIPELCQCEGRDVSQNIFNTFLMPTCHIWCLHFNQVQCKYDL